VRLPFILIELAGLLWGLYGMGGNRERILWLGAVISTFPIFRALTLVDALIVRVGVDRGDPLFISVFGWSLPVFAAHLSALIALVGFLSWGRRGLPRS